MEPLILQTLVFPVVYAGVEPVMAKCLVSIRDMFTLVASLLCILEALMAKHNFAICNEQDLLLSGHSLDLPPVLVNILVVGCDSGSWGAGSRHSTAICPGRSGQGTICHCTLYRPPNAVFFPPGVV